ncbi:hypothetical protein K0M31_010296 [Melipona bicolor]|uniref:Uncharacterized protein n=1 Tax=Melipona bicolor TaxID=60889 RepID=A0AA40KIH9_9HYME|nr:hypothetical protein K0M31_010296 [Melipona bicolor]
MDGGEVTRVKSQRSVEERKNGQSRGISLVPGIPGSTRIGNRLPTPSPPWEGGGRDAFTFSSTATFADVADTAASI